MFLTTNRVKDFDVAFHSRISVALCYGPLGFDTRRTIWEIFLKKEAAVNKRAKFTSNELDWLAKRESNGRQVCYSVVSVYRFSNFPSKQIKNIVSTAHALAMSEGKPLSQSHLKVVIDLDEEFQNDYNGAGHTANNMSYR